MGAFGWILAAGAVAGVAYAMKSKQGEELPPQSAYELESYKKRTRFSGAYRERVVQALEEYEGRQSRRSGALGERFDAPTRATLEAWVAAHPNEIAKARKQRVPVMQFASALAKDGGEGNYLYRAFEYARKK